MTRAYVAGSVHEIDRVRVVQDLCKRVGWSITFDWTRDKENAFSEPDSPRPIWSEQPDKARELALKEYHGVRFSDIVIWLYSEKSLGAIFEAAWGIETGELWVVGCDRESPFLHLHDGIKLLRNENALFDLIMERQRQIDQIMHGDLGPIILRPDAA